MIWENKKNTFFDYLFSFRLEFSFAQSNSKTAVMRGISGMQYMSGNTRTGTALRYADTIFDIDTRANAKQVSIANIPIDKMVL